MLSIPEKSLTELLDDACRRYADRICLSQDDESLTYRDVYDKSLVFARAFVAAGLKKGYSAAIFTPNDMRAVPIIIGIIRAGGIWLPVNPRNSVEENVQLLQKFGCDALIVHHVFEDHVGAIKKEFPDLEIVLGLDEQCKSVPAITDWAADAPEDVEFPLYEPSDLIFTPTTGGTTGVPKAVGLSHRNFVAVLTGIKEMSQQTDPPVYLAAAPMTHVGGRIVLSMMNRGGRSVVFQRFDPQETLRTIEKERITEIFLPPSGIYTLLDQPNVRDFDYSSLTQVAYGSAPMSIDRLKEALRVFGPVMQGGFGQTECPMMIATLPPEEHFVDNDINGDIAPDERLRSCGRATVISELGIMDDDGALLPPGERGEIVVKGPMAMEGYVNDPEETAKTRRNGWHLTGDIGYLNDEGYLYIVDRKKDMIVTGGFNVYSAEVEGVVTTIEGVIECAVIGIPDEKWGEAVKAIVRRADDTISENMIIETCKARLGGVKAPKSVDFVDDFPRTPIGKIRKRDLRDQYWEGRDRKV